MCRLMRRLIATCALVALASAIPQAQFVVHDPLNYAQALARYAQLIEQLKLMVKQSQRLPVDMGTRYRVPAVRWHFNDPEGIYPYARAILASLNVGDSAGTGYNQIVDRLDPLDELLPRVPPELQRRLAMMYGTIQLVD